MFFLSKDSPIWHNPAVAPLVHTLRVSGRYFLAFCLVFLLQSVLMFGLNFGMLLEYLFWVVFLTFSSLFSVGGFSGANPLTLVVSFILLFSFIGLIVSAIVWVITYFRLHSVIRSFSCALVGTYGPGVSYSTSTASSVETSEFDEVVESVGNTMVVEEHGNAVVSDQDVVDIGFE